MRPIDEYGALIYAGRWGIHGASLPGRVTFAPGNVGFSTFGASRPMEVGTKNTFHCFGTVSCRLNLLLCYLCTDTNNQ